MTAADVRNVTEAADRLFKAYEGQCVAPDASTLFYTLTALHSLNDRLKATGRTDFHGFDEFVALKAVRNFAHHHDEVRSNVRIVRSPLFSDLMFLCLVRRDQVDQAIATTKPEKWVESTRLACQKVFHWYGPAVNINPALFNLMVRIYEALDAQNLIPESDPVAAFTAAYKREAASSLSHFIDGRLSGHAAQITSALTDLVADLPGA